MINSWILGSGTTYTHTSTKHKKQKKKQQQKQKSKRNNTNETTEDACNIQRKARKNIELISSLMLFLTVVRWNLPLDIP